MKKAIVIMSAIVTIGCIISIGGAYAATTYAISTSKIGYTDNSNLGADNVQAAIDGTCTKFNTQLTNLKTNIIDTIYPVGSIYTSETDSSVTAVQNRFKNFGKDTTWVAYGAGKVLVGSGTGTDANGNSQAFSVSNNSKNLGEYTHKLTVSEMPSHTHIQNPHSHDIGFDNGIKHIGSAAGSAEPDTSVYLTNLVYGGRVFSMLANSTTATNQNTGGSESHNNIQPYTTVYMYKRTK